MNYSLFGDCRDNAHIILDLVDDTIHSLPQPISILTRQLLATGPSWIFANGIKAFQDTSNIFFWVCSEDPL